MAENILGQGISLYRQKSYTGALSFFLSLPVDCGADKNEIAYYLGLCYAKLQRYDDALLYLEQVVTSGTHLERTLQCRFLLAVIYALSKSTPHRQTPESFAQALPPDGDRVP